MNTESELTHGCIPQNFCIMSSVKGECIFQCWIHARLTLFQGFLFEVQILVPCVKENPKNTPDECNEDRTLVIAQELSKNQH